MLVGKFFQEAHGKDKQKVRDIYRHYERRWIVFGKQATFSKKPIEIHTDEFEQATVSSYNDVYLHAINDQTKKNMLRTIRIIEGRSRMHYFIRHLILETEKLFTKKK